MKLQRINLIAIAFLLFFIVSALSGEDKNGEIVSYARHPPVRLPPTTGNGWIAKWECDDSTCRHNCQMVSSDYVYFGECMGINRCPGTSKKFHCSWSNRVLGFGYNNPNCQAPAYTQIRTDGCYPQEHFRSNNENGQCEHIGNVGQPRKYYKFSCYLEQQNLVHMAQDEKEASVVHMNVGIAVAVLLSVCMIGVIAGYLIHRKRKLSAERKLLCDANQNDADQYSLHNNL